MLTNILHPTRKLSTSQTLYSIHLISKNYKNTTSYRITYIMDNLPYILQQHYTVYTMPCYALQKFIL